MKKVLAAIVTYNRLELLKRCIDHLSEQTYHADLLVVNNSSPDGTEAWLKTNGVDFVTQPNGGSSAGWWRCIKEAMERGYDYVWLMDDDGFPDKKALELLVDKMDEKTACISSVVVKENKRNEFVFGVPVLNQNGNPVLFSAKRKYSSLEQMPEASELYPFAHLFNGALINLLVVKQIGNINKDYFLYGDEVDYFCRMRQVGGVYSLTRAFHYHPDVSQRRIDKTRVYYFIRNTFILNKKYFDHRFLRNLFTVGVALARILKRDGVGTFFSYLVGKNSKYVFYGMKDGINHNFIKRY
jgi:rhamnopyranosyl-N-acetylglucosaminyl-diphospho-decaprenol beta-1,3/1,4-galactofuranosyltransferase